MEFIKRYGFPLLIISVLIILFWNILTQLVNNTGVKLSFGINKIGVILTSIILVNITLKQESIDTEINKFFGLIRGYFNLQYIKNVIFYDYLDLLAYTFEKQINFFEDIDINPNNPILLPQCNETEINKLKSYQKNIKDLSKERVAYKFLKYLVMVEIIICLLFG